MQSPSTRLTTGSVTISRNCQLVHRPANVSVIKFSLTTRELLAVCGASKYACNEVQCAYPMLLLEQKQPAAKMCRA